MKVIHFSVHYCVGVALCMQGHLTAIIETFTAFMVSYTYSLAYLLIFCC